MNLKTLWHKKPKQQDKKTVVIDQIDSFKYKTVIETRFADFDMMGHVNNATYFTFMEIAREKYWKQAVHWDWKKTGVVIAKASINYILPVLPEEQISMYVRTARIGKTSFDLEYVLVKMQLGKEVICSAGTTVCVAFDYQTKSPTDIPEQERTAMQVFEQLNDSA